MMPLVERLTIGSCAGSLGSFFTSDSVGFRRVASSVNQSSAFLNAIAQTLNQGVTHTYLIVNASRRISFTGIASNTLIAKN